MRVGSHELVHPLLARENSQNSPSPDMLMLIMAVDICHHTQVARDTVQCMYLSELNEPSGDKQLTMVNCTGEAAGMRPNGDGESPGVWRIQGGVHVDEWMFGREGEQAGAQR